MDLKRMVQTAQELEARGPESQDPMAKLYVVSRHTKWLELTEEDQVYSEEALDWAMKLLRRDFKYTRSGRYSPSSIGECNRRVVLGYNGAPQDPFDLDSLDLMSMGTRDHFWWQLEGITMGWIVEAEAWRHVPDLRLGGSLDAIMADDSIFELKTVISSKYSRILREGSPLHAHVLQVHAYFLLSGLRWASIVYQSRDTGDFYEFRVEHDQSVENELMGLLTKLDRYVDADELPEILDDCEMRTGTIYKQCPVRSECLKLHREGR